MSDAQREAHRLMQCRLRRETADRDGAEALRRAQVELGARLEGSDPVRDAAAARGDFRLIRGIAMMGTAAMGVECRTSDVNRWQGQPLTLGTRFYSDVPGSCETGGGRDACRTEALLDAYGPAYSRALVGNPPYPYGDLCRVPPGRLVHSFERPRDVSQYGFPDLAPTDRAHDLTRRRGGDRRPRSPG